MTKNPMPWSTKALPDGPIIETRYTRNPTQAELSEAVQDALNIASHHGTRLFLNNCTYLTGRGAIFELYFLAEAIGLRNRYSVKEAVLAPLPSLSAEGIRFWDTLCSNRGIKAQLFHDRDSSLQWLLCE